MPTFLPLDFAELAHQLCNEAGIPFALVENHLEQLGNAPSDPQGRGLIITVRDREDVPSAWVSVCILRRKGCELPIQVWFHAEADPGEKLQPLLDPWGVKFVKANTILGRSVKACCLLEAEFSEILLLQADSLPLRDPADLFDHRQYLESGAAVWLAPEAVNQDHPAKGLNPTHSATPTGCDAGCLLINRAANWDAIRLATLLLEHAKLCRRFDRLENALAFVWNHPKKPFARVDTPPESFGLNPDAGILRQHDFEGEHLFQRRGWFKWHIHCDNPRISGSLLDLECREALEDLKRGWDGKLAGAWEGASGHSSAAKEYLYELCSRRWIAPGLKSLSPFGPVVPDPASPIGAEQETTLTQLPRRPAPEGLSQATFWGEDFREISFKENGSLGNTSDRRLQFWSLRTEPELEMSIYGDARRGGRWTLKRLGDGWWSGDYQVAGRKKKLSLHTIEHAYPQSRPQPDCSSPSYRRFQIASALRAKYGPAIRLVNTNVGMGDHVVSVYAAAAAADTGVEVIFHTRFPRWLSRVSHPRLTIDGAMPHDLEGCIRDGTVLNVNASYSQQLRFGHSRVGWYTQNIHPLLRPRRHQNIDTAVHTRCFDADRYAIIAPCGSSSNRDWPVVHWQRLIVDLQACGVETFVIGTGTNRDTLEQICVPVGAFWVVDHDPEWVMNALAGAFVIIGNDSGIPHLGGLLEVPTVAISSQLPADFLWANTDIVGLNPKTTCSDCRWLPERGYHSICKTTCSAIATVTPDEVMAAVQSATSKREDAVFRHTENQP